MNVSRIAGPVTTNDATVLVSGPVKGRPVLVVEDDVAIREVMATILCDEGYEVETASDGAQGIAAIVSRRPSLVVLDMHMPVLDGWGFAAQLKDCGFDPPILVVTATSHEALEAASEIGAAGSLAKPFRLPEFLEAVATLRVP